jgi:hypothetical protein
VPGGIRHPLGPADCGIDDRAVGGGCTDNWLRGPKKSAANGVAKSAASARPQAVASAQPLALGLNREGAAASETAN